MLSNQDNKLCLKSAMRKFFCIFEVSLCVWFFFPSLIVHEFRVSKENCDSGLETISLSISNYF